MKEKIKVQNVTKRFKIKMSTIEVFNSLNFSCNENEIISFIGPSGCGKTTLINLIAGFIMPDYGIIYVDDKVINGPHYTRSVIFQDNAVFPWLNVKQNIAYGLESRKMKKDFIEDKLNEYISIFDLEEHKNSFSKTLSGGEKKRVDLARALINDPDIVLMDEPFGSLDSITKERLQAFVLDFFQDHKKTIIFITHDIEEAILMSDKINLLSRKPSKIFKSFEVPIRRHREVSIKYSSEFQDFRREILNEFKNNSLQDTK